MVKFICHIYSYRIGSPDDLPQKHLLLALKGLELRCGEIGIESPGHPIALLIYSNLVAIAQRQKLYAPAIS